MLPSVRLFDEGVLTMPGVIKGRRGGRVALAIVVLAGVTGAFVAAGALGKTRAPGRTGAASSFGDMPLSKMIAAARGYPVPKKLPNFHGAKVTVMGDGGHNMNVFGFWWPEWKKAGIKLNPVEVPFADLYSKEKAEFIAGTRSVDLVVFYPAYIGDFASNGYLRPLNDYIKKYNPHLSDVITAFRKLYLSWAGKVYALPEDGDVHIYIYRKDLLNKPAEKAAFQKQYHRTLTVPKTWDEYLQVGKFFTRKAGQTLGGKKLSRPFYGCGEYGQRGFSWAWFMDRYASAGGIYFDRNMKPLIATPAAIKSLENMVAAVKQCSPPDVLNFGYDQLRDCLLKSECFQVVQWTDVPKKGADPTQSEVVGKLGYALLPGTRVGGKINTRSMMPVGRVLAVTKNSKSPEAAYWVAKFISDDTSKFNVSTPLDGLDPYRYSQLKPQYYKVFKSKADAKSYLTTVRGVLEHGFPEIFIPGAAQYEDALDLAVNKAISGQQSPATALQDAAKAWEQITDKLNRKHQIQLWRRALKTYRELGLVK
jgi:multiple sugar transport system substrate-binding protein